MKLNKKFKEFTVDLHKLYNNIRANVASAGTIVMYDRYAKAVK